MKNIEIKNSTKCNVECQVIDDTTIRIVINDEYVPKDGDFVRKTNGWILIFKEIGTNNECIRYASFNPNINEFNMGGHGHYCGLMNTIDGPATPEEIQLLTDKLEEQGKRWNAEKKVIEDLPKEPKVGDMCIFWDNDKREAICGIRKAHYEEGSYYTNEDISYNNCIPFESVEQYKKFISND